MDVDPEAPSPASSPSPTMPQYMFVLLLLTRDSSSKRAFSLSKMVGNVGNAVCRRVRVLLVLTVVCAALLL